MKIFKTIFLAIILAAFVCIPVLANEFDPFSPENIAENFKEKADASAASRAVIKEYIAGAAEDDVLVKNYCAAYPNNNGDLVILLYGELEECREAVECLIPGSGFLYKITSYRKEFIEEVYDRLVDEFGESFKAFREGGSADEDAAALIAAKPSFTLMADNSIQVAFVAENEEELNGFAEIFKIKYGDCDYYRFSFRDPGEYYEMKFDSVINAGDFTSWSNVPITGYSIGYRAYRSTDSGNEYGFVTAGHNGTGTNTTMYTYVGSNLLACGTVRFNDTGDSSETDIAFVETNSGFTVSSIIANTADSTGTPNVGRSSRRSRRGTSAKTFRPY